MDDICYLDKNAEDVVEAPLIIVGSCTGNVTLAQQVLNTLFPSTSNLREFGGGLYDALVGSNLDEQSASQIINNYLVDTRSYLETELDIIIEIAVDSVSLIDRQLVIRLSLATETESSEVEVSINTEG